jgi:hypothetical protein
MLSSTSTVNSTLKQSLVTHDPYIHKSEKYEKSFFVQKLASVLAVVFAFIGWLLIFFWCNGNGTEDSYVGGLDFGTHLFNLHPVFMYLGMVFFGTAAVVSFRWVPLPKIWVKYLHILCHTASLMCVITGLTCVFVSNNYVNQNDEGIYYSNFTSLHSYLGLGTVILYFQNYAFGLYFFLSSLEAVPVTMRKAYMPIHIFLGTFTYIMIIITVEVGIMELNAELGCYYDVYSADTNPAANYYKLPSGCKLSNGAGIIVGFTALFTYFALYNFPAEPVPAAKKEISDENNGENKEGDIGSCSPHHGSESSTGTVKSRFDSRIESNAINRSPFHSKDSQVRESNIQMN